jgi:hypothetical protein
MNRSGTGLVDMTTLLSPCLDQNVFEFPNHPFNLPVDVTAFQQNLDEFALQRRTLECSVLYARVAYCASRLASLPHVFASSGQTIFIHLQKFQALQSPALQQAMSACALYSIQNPATKAIVHQVIQSNVQHLLSTTNSSTSSNHDLLAALQALLLYQLMRLFDGSIRLRAAAEACEPTAILWAEELRTRACATTLPLHPVSTLGDTTPDWQLWLFHESIRRTVLTAFLLRGVYNYLKTGTDIPTVVGVYFTAQSRLWNAQSEASWTRAVCSSLELQVFVSVWDSVISLAAPDDLEELGVLVMSMLWGLPATRGWLGWQQCGRYGLQGSDDLGDGLGVVTDGLGLC